jgi:phosphoribosylglycinamide formyltransferase-1
MAEPVRVAVLLSGRGSNMLALSEYKRRDPDRAYRLAFVASNVPEARGLVLARRLGIETWSMSHAGLERAEFDRLVDAELRKRDIEAVALAGYMRLLSDEFVAAWQGRIVNIHPSLLPAYKGLDTHRRAIEAGEIYAGCSVHLVTPDLDGGPVIAQSQVKIRQREDPAELAARILEEEHRLYPPALEAFCLALRGESAPLPSAAS